MQLRRVSASQVNAFKRCQRYWYFGWIDKLKPAPTEAMQRGIDIHTEIEHWFKTQRVRDHKYAPYVRAAIPQLPDPKGAKELLVEHEIKIPCGNGITWIGYIDVLHCDRNPLLVLDTKTTSDFRYAKTPEELRHNTQLNSYAKYVYEMGHEGLIQLAHLYIKTGKRVPKRPKTKLVNVLTDQDQVERVWTDDLDTVRQMADTAACVQSAHELPPTTSACGMYGGCPFREKCGLALSDFMKPTRTGTKAKKGTGPMSSLLERLQKRQKGNGTNGQSKATDVPPVATKPTGVLADDAPSRETPVETDEEKTAKTDAAKTDKPKKKRKSTARKKAVAAEGLHLYIDCVPVKDVNGADIDPTLFEDWIGPIVHALNEEVREHREIPDYRLLPFSEEKAAFAAAVEAKVEQLPMAMIVNTGTPGSKEALAVLIPHATKVTRAIR